MGTLELCCTFSLESAELFFLSMYEDVNSVIYTRTSIEIDRTLANFVVNFFQYLLCCLTKYQTIALLNKIKQNVKYPSIP